MIELKLKDLLTFLILMCFSQEKLCSKGQNIEGLRQLGPDQSICFK